MMQVMHASELARACADVMRSGDTVTRELGIELVSVDLGQAIVAMTVTENMVNGFGACHGGVLFTLADAAFGFACNTYNQRAVGQHCSITYIAPAYRGDRLVARATERSRASRSGVYDVTITREEGLVIAEYRGICRTMEGELVPGVKAKGLPQTVDSSR